MPVKGRRRPPKSAPPCDLLTDLRYGNLFCAIRSTAAIRLLRARRSDGTPDIQARRDCGRTVGHAALVVDLNALLRNIETLHAFFRDRDAKVRPHVASHLCPAIAHKQIAAGGTVGGISVATVGQAEVFAQRGFDDILIANEVVTRRKIERVCAMAGECSVTLACDSPDNVRTCRTRPPLRAWTSASWSTYTRGPNGPA